MRWNPFAKDEKEEEKKVLSNIPGMPDTKNMNMFQRFAMRRLEKMSPAEREKVMRKAMTPKNIENFKLIRRSTPLACWAVIRLCCGSQIALSPEVPSTARTSMGSCISSATQRIAITSRKARTAIRGLNTC